MLLIYTVLIILASLFILASLLSSTLSLYFEVHFWRSVKGKARNNHAINYPSVTVLMPVRGIDQYIEGNIRSILNQDYPGVINYMFIFDSEDDPGYKVIRELVKGLNNVRLLILNDGEGKSYALSMGLRHVNTDLVAFVDSDALVPSDWLLNMVNELLKGNGASTTYRFYVPLRRYSLGSLLRSSFNMIGITAMQNKVARFTWGGSTVTWTWLINKWSMADYLPYYLSDDYVITHAVHKEGLSIAFVPQSMVITLEDVDIRDAFNWAVRQLWYVRIYGFNGFLLYAFSYTLLALTLPLGIVSSIFISPWFLLITVIPYIIGSVKDYYRVRSIRGISHFHAQYINDKLPVYLGILSVLNVYFSWIAIIRTINKREIVWRGRLFTEEEARARMLSKPLP